MEEEVTAKILAMKRDGNRAAAQAEDIPWSTASRTEEVLCRGANQNQLGWKKA